MIKKVLIVVAVAAALVCAGGTAFVNAVVCPYVDHMGEVAATAPLCGGTYYLQVDNDHVDYDVLRDSDMPYRYELDAYAEDGGATTVIFQTSRELRDGAYLRFEAAFMRGLISWEEVQQDELPSAVAQAMGRA
ncbi:YxeA family protein [Collinsella tanakaei]|uniref:YxeA family protein n=1 Tax=Collinsella tanakaei TaxID=626935 RepID=UPI0025A42D7A|nr:YxeA family protein [Collinsella tanakaei]MDM8246441.1 YxeA family protein [Collinsella tanakaei]